MNAQATITLSPERAKLYADKLTTGFSLDGAREPIGAETLAALRVMLDEFERRMTMLSWGEPDSPVHFVDDHDSIVEIAASLMNHAGDVFTNSSSAASVDELREGLELAACGIDILYQLGELLEEAKQITPMVPPAGPLGIEEV